MYRSVIGATLFALASTANATLVTVNHVYSPANVLLGSISGESLSSPFTLGLGDTLDMTMTFAGGATGTFTGESSIFLLSLTNSGSGTLGVSGTFEFLGASSNIVSGPIAVSDTNLFIHVGQFLTAGQYRLDANPISFTGLRMILTVDSSDVGPRDYYSIGLTHFDGKFSTGGAVPEPAAWAMLIAGFGLVGAARRQQRRTALA